MCNQPFFILLHRPFKCSTCSKTFKTANNLRLHNRQHTTNDNIKFTCTTCNKVFTRADRLKNHQLIHFGPKKFSCDVCCKAFLRKAHLEAHRRVHTGNLSILLIISGKGRVNLLEFGAEIKINRFI